MPFAHLTTMIIFLNIIFNLWFLLNSSSSRELDDLQLHRAELSGHFAIVSIFETLSHWSALTNPPTATSDIPVGCDDKSSLRIYNTNYVFDPPQKGFDLLSSLQSRIKQLLDKVKGEWVDGHQDSLKMYF